MTFVVLVVTLMSSAMFKKNPFRVSCFPQNKKLASAFTLVELLVVTGVVALLGGLAFSAFGGVQKKGDQMREAAAAKSLITAYLNYSADQNGQLMVAHYEGSASDLDASPQAILPSGERLSGGALHRYPYRLAPYFNYQIDGVILVNQNKRVVPELFPGNMSDYGNSLCPAFGINYYFAGGYMVDDELQRPEECVMRLAQAPEPSRMLIFATAASTIEGKRVEGRFGVEPPAYRTELWTTSQHVDPRHNDRALCVFLDGSIRHHSIDELRDMRYWSPRAQLADNANYRVAAQGSGGVGGGSGGRR